MRTVRISDIYGKPIGLPKEWPKKVEHGTEYGYELHRRYGIPSCKACRRANAKRSAKNNKSKNKNNTTRET